MVEPPPEENPFIEKAQENIEAGRKAKEKEEALGTFSLELGTGNGSRTRFLEGSLKAVSPSLNIEDGTASLGVTNLLDIEEVTEGKNGEPVLRKTKETRSFLLGDSGELAFDFALEEGERLKEKGRELRGLIIKTGAPNLLETVRAYNTQKAAGKGNPLKRIEAELRRFVYLTDDRKYTLSASWILGTYFYRIFEAFPYLHLLGEKASGKTQHAEAIYALSFRPIFAVQTSPSALFRWIDSTSGTVIIDEEERLGKRQKVTDDRLEALTSILNSGYRKGGTVIRSEGGEGKKRATFTPIAFDVFGPKVISNIEGIDSATLRDRTIKLVMVRIKGGRPENPTSEKVKAGLEPLRYELLADFLLYWKEVKAAFGSMVAEINRPEPSAELGHLVGRNGDLWLPLLALARTFGDGSEYSALLELSKEHAEGKIEDESEDSDISLVLKACELALGGKGSEKVTLSYLKQLARGLKQEKEGLSEQDTEWLKEKWVGKQLDKLGLYGPKQKGYAINHKAAVLLTASEIKDRAERYGIVLSDLGKGGEGDSAGPGGEAQPLPGSWTGTPQELRKKLEGEGVAVLDIPGRLKTLIDSGKLIKHRADFWEVRE